MKVSPFSSNDLLNEKFREMEQMKDEFNLADDKLSKFSATNDAEKEKKLLNLIVEIIVKITLKKYYETCD